MKRLKKTVLFFFSLLFVSLFSACDLYTYVTPSTEVSYDNPAWAPPYVQGVRYYYLPDIEAYYDLSAHEFVYLDNGQWSYSPGIPTIYGSFDLNDCFTVALDYNTYQPWMHHHYYVSHYPRYYYRDYYDHSNIPYVRGFNENSKSAVYWRENERTRARSWDNQNLKSNHQFIYSRPDRQQQNSSLYNNDTRVPTGNNDVRRQQDNGYNSTQRPARNDNKGTAPASQETDNTNRQQGNGKTGIVAPPRTSGFETGSRQQQAITPVNAPQRTNYYGRTIGQPVKVENQMRQRTQTTNRTANTANSNNSRNQNDSNRR